MRIKWIMMGTLSVVALPLLQARNWCTNADLAGSYGLSASGAIMQPDKTPITGPFARAGGFVADGNGGLVFKTTASYNGLIFAEPYAGSYTVNPDCTVTFLIAVPAPVNLPAVFAGVISDDNRQAQIMLVNPPGTSITGVARRQEQSFCGVANLSGVFVLEMSGSYVAPSPLEGGFKRLGKLVADGAGNFSVSSTANYNGLSVPETFTGTYTMGQDCQMELKYSQPGPKKDDKNVATTIQGVLTDKGKSAYLIVSEPASTVILGSLKAQ